MRKYNKFNSNFNTNKKFSKYKIKIKKTLFKI